MLEKEVAFTSMSISKAEFNWAKNERFLSKVRNSLYK